MKTIQQDMIIKNMVTCLVLLFIVTVAQRQKFVPKKEPLKSEAIPE